MAGHMFTDGENLTAEKTNQYLNHSIIEPVPYTPTVTGAAATATGSYVKLGRLVMVEFIITFTGAATGSIGLSRPVTGAPGTGQAGIGTALAIDGGANATRRTITVIGDTPGTNVYFLLNSSTPNEAVTATTPWTWASGDTIAGRFSYWEA